MCWVSTASSSRSASAFPSTSAAAAAFPSAVPPESAPPPPPPARPTPQPSTPSAAQEATAFSRRCFSRTVAARSPHSLVTTRTRATSPRQGARPAAATGTCLVVGWLSGRVGEKLDWGGGGGQGKRDVVEVWAGADLCDYGALVLFLGCLGRESRASWERGRMLLSSVLLETLFRPWSLFTTTTSYSAMSTLRLGIPRDDLSLCEAFRLSRPAPRSGPIVGSCCAPFHVRFCPHRLVHHPTSMSRFPVTAVTTPWTLHNTRLPAH